jgi:cytoskeletal protein RodZ
MKIKVKVSIVILVIILVMGLFPITASATTTGINIDTDTSTTINTETEETTTRTRDDDTEYTHTTTTTSTTTVNSSSSIVFHPVRSITNVPNITTVRIPLTLTATIGPREATNKKIIWDVTDPGTTGAYITGDNVLNTTAPGTVTIRAIITNGANANVDFTERFSVTILSPGFETAPARITNFSEHASFSSSGNFHDLYAISLNDHELILTDDNERILLFGYPGFNESLGRVTEGSNVIRLNRTFLNFLPDGIYTLSATYRTERANGRPGRVYATTDTIFVLDRALKNEVPPTGDDSNILIWSIIMIASMLGISALLVLFKPWQYRRQLFLLNDCSFK